MLSSKSKADETIRGNVFGTDLFGNPGLMSNMDQVIVATGASLRVLGNTFVAGNNILQLSPVPYVEIANNNFGSLTKRRHCFKHSFINGYSSSTGLLNGDGNTIWTGTTGGVSRI